MGRDRPPTIFSFTALRVGPKLARPGSSALERRRAPERHARRTAMGTMITRHAIRDYGAWRPVFDAHVPAQAAAGLTNGRVYRSAEDPNDILILFDMADRRRAEEFCRSGDLRATMESAGVVGQPEHRFAD